MVETPHPWQSGPAELIAFALEQSHKQGELNQRIAFLLLDVSVETLFKTFLVLPDSVTSTGLSHYERKKAAEGNFHELCDGIKKAASKRLEGIDLTHIQYYHDLRNKLYHQGNGINVGKVDVRNYAKLSVNLLQRLLEVDLFDELNQPLVDQGTAPSKERRKGKSSKSGQLATRYTNSFLRSCSPASNKSARGRQAHQSPLPKIGSGSALAGRATFLVGCFDEINSYASSFMLIRWMPGRIKSRLPNSSSAGTKSRAG